MNDHIPNNPEPDVDELDPIDAYRRAIAATGRLNVDPDDPDDPVTARRNAIRPWR